jgi:hypothetical protein
MSLIHIGSRKGQQEAAFNRRCHPKSIEDAYAAMRVDLQPDTPRS